MLAYELYVPDAVCCHCAHLLRSLHSGTGCDHSRDHRILCEAFEGKNLWLYHNADDFVVTPEIARSLVKVLERQGKKKGIGFFYTECPEERNLCHGNWEPTYEDTLMCRWVLFRSNKTPVMMPPPDMGNIPCLW